MEVVSLAHAQQMVAEGRFLVHQEVLGHVYGVTRASVRRAQARGKLPLLDMDRVADVAQLKAGGLQVCARAA
jgi:guanylate kinase